jgi:glutathione S-transferase
MFELYFSPGACSFVPHVALEAAKAPFEPKLVKLHRGEQRAPEFLALNPNAQVPVLVVEGKPLTQIVAICDFLDRRFPHAAFLPREAWERAQALSQLAWMNSTPHTTMTRFFFPERFADSEGARTEVKQRAARDFRGHLERVQETIAQMRGWFHDAYAFTLLRWGGFAGIDPSLLPAYKRHVEGAMQAEPFKAALARERIALDTYKA